MREKAVEQHLVQRVKAAGGQCYKWASPGIRGVPDRLVVLPFGRVIAVEVKAPGKRPTALQERALAQLQGLGVAATWVDSKEAVDSLLGAIEQAMQGEPA